MVNIGTLVAVLRADVSRFLPQMRKAGAEAKSTSSKINSLSGAMAGFAAAAGGSVFAVAAQDLARLAASADDSIAIFEASGGSLETMRKATKGMISDVDIAKKGNLADILNISKKQFEELSKVAVAASKVTSISTKEAFERAILGTAKMEKEILEEIGVVFKAESAFKKYAKSIGTTAAKLTDAQKSQAFTNEVIARGQVVIKKAELAGISAAEGFARMTAAVENLKVEVGTQLVPIMGTLGGIFETVLKYITDMDPKTKAILTLFSEWALVGSIVVGVLGAVAGGIAAFGVLLPVLLPVILAMAKITLLVGGAIVAIGLLRKAWVENWVVMGLPMQDWLKFLKVTLSETGTVIMNISKAVALAIADIMTFVPRTLGKVLTFIGRQVKSFADLIARAVKSIPMPIQKMMGIDGGKVAGGIGKIGAQLNLALSSVEEFAVDTRDILAQVLDVGGQIGGAATFWTDWFTDNEAALKAAGAETLDGLMQMLKEGGEGFKDLLVDILGVELAKKVENKLKKADKADQDEDKRDDKKKKKREKEKDKGGGVLGVLSGASNDIGAAMAMMTGVMQDPIVQGLLFIAEKAFAGMLMVFDSIFSGRFREVIGGALGSALTATISAVLLPVVVALGALAAAASAVGTAIVIGVLMPLAPIAAILAGIALVLTGIALPVALTGFAFGLATSSKSFEDFQKVMDSALEPLINAAWPVFNTLMPLAGLFSMMGELLAPIIGMFVQWGPMMWILFNATKAVAVGMLFVAEASALATLQFELAGRLSEARVAIASITIEEAEAKARNVLATERATESLGSLNEQLFNLDNSPIFRRMAFAATDDPSQHRFVAGAGRPRGA